MTLKPERQHFWVLLFLGAGLAAMLLASLWWRFQQPSLTISRFGGAAQSRAPVQADGMGAIGRLMEQAAKNPHDAPVLLKLTESLMAVGQWESAENFAQKALNETPGENPRAIYLLAVIHHNLGRHGAAAELLEKLLARQENPSARYSLAILYIYFLDKPEAGRGQLEKGIASGAAPQALLDAMRQELAKLPPAPGEGVSENQPPENGSDAGAAKSPAAQTATE